MTRTSFLILFSFITLMCSNKKKVTKSHFEEAIGRVRPTVTPEMLEYYQKMETRLTSGMSNIKRTKDFSHGIETM